MYVLTIHISVTKMKVKMLNPLLDILLDLDLEKVRLFFRNGVLEGCLKLIFEARRK